MSESLSAPQLLRIRGKLETIVAEQAGTSKAEQATAALQRLRTGEYGYCVECGDEISAARLAAKPEVALCVDCQALKDEEEDA
ncbi:TraR/DksA family transcriptional regulator [Pseudidiomarina sp.]|uniref:TraR/DksA family transcriptional regulator n=1 Tax=Pseudidiomarina sp. TaxID=2081707 RepID=UPI00299D44EE|nr:TraR/DksA C4-type zinc finger protein [Pseudidiomarina sp.]MDX1706020.1 TraR/DksA C4-type zinc finger protein [Pseudidiomarina sp.]